MFERNAQRFETVRFSNKCPLGCERTSRKQKLLKKSNLGITTTEGTGSKWSYFSGGLICQVWFKKFQYGVVHVSLHGPWHQRSVVPTRKWGVIGTDRAKQSLQTRWSLVQSACEGTVRQSKKCFFAQFDVCGRFSQVESTRRADLRWAQFAFLRWLHFQEGTPYIWIHELKGLKLCVRNFQVVAFVRWSQGQVRLYTIQKHSSISVRLGVDRSWANLLIINVMIF